MQRNASSGNLCNAIYCQGTCAMQYTARAPVQRNVSSGNLCNAIYCQGTCATECIVREPVQCNILPGHLCNGTYHQGNCAMEYIARAPVQRNITSRHLNIKAPVQWNIIISGNLCNGIDGQETCAMDYIVRAPGQWNILLGHLCNGIYIIRAPEQSAGITAATTTHMAFFSSMSSILRCTFSLRGEGRFFFWLGVSTSTAFFSSMLNFCRSSSLFSASNLQPHTSPWSCQQCALKPFSITGTTPKSLVMSAVCTKAIQHYRNHTQVPGCVNSVR